MPILQAMVNNWTNYYCVVFPLSTRPGSCLSPLLPQCLRKSLEQSSYSMNICIYVFNKDLLSTLKMRKLRLQEVKLNASLLV